MANACFQDDRQLPQVYKSNGAAICKVCSQFVMLCRQLNLFVEASVTIDGSKFKAVNNRDKNYTIINKIERRREQIEAGTKRYLSAIDTAERQEPTDFTEAKIKRLTEKLDKLKNLPLAAMQKKPWWQV